MRINFAQSFDNPSVNAEVALLRTHQAGGYQRAIEFLTDFLMTRNRMVERTMGKIKIAIVGVGNCASSLLQGIHYYSDSKGSEKCGLTRAMIGEYSVPDIEIVAAFDIDVRKVGQRLDEAVFQAPNCTTRFCHDIPQSPVIVKMGRIMDGISEHMSDYDTKVAFQPSGEPEASKEQIVKELMDSGAEILLNYLPVGSEEATRFYVECALEAGLGLVNCIPVFIATDPEWSRKFEERGLPVIGDDVKSQLGATIAHRTLVDLFMKRGVKLDRTYQLNTGGNTDFLNMLNRSRLSSKKKSKTESVQSVCSEPMPEHNIHVGPSDYVPWQNDNKVCFIRMEGRLFGDVPMNLELRLSVEDSPNSAGVVIDAIRCMKLALDRQTAGVLVGPSALFMKRPPKQFTDEQAHEMTESFIKGQ